MTQTVELSETRRGVDGIHGTVFGQSDSELFAAQRRALNPIPMSQIAKTVIPPNKRR